jgi:hypothetical protein
VATTQWCVAIVDVEDAWLLLEYKWLASGKYRSGAFYAVSDTYAKETGKSGRLHRIVRPEIQGQIDHINRNGHDCRRQNLRPATPTESARNRGKPSTVNPSSRFKGVAKRGNMYQAHIRVDGELIHLGMFGFESDAAIAYNVHAAHYFGEFVRLNDLTSIECVHD